MNIILASASPRRRTLFSLTGWSADTFATDIPEVMEPEEVPEAYVRRLAAQKASHAAAQIEPDHSTLVIAADTIVVDRCQVLEKPGSASEAFAMLMQLRGRVHQVFTAMTVLDAVQGISHHCMCITDVPMREYSDREISGYVESGHAFDKAGAYGIQDRSFSPVDPEKLNGCFANVMGLPLCHLVVLLQQFEMYPEVDVPEACQCFTDYRCPVYSGILGGEPCVEQS
jgi:septum formation protein